MKFVVTVVICILLLAVIAGGGTRNITDTSTARTSGLEQTNGTSETLLAEGKSLLAAHSLLAARDKFKQAVVEDPGNQEANLLYGVTRVIAVVEDGQELSTGSLDSVREILELTGVVFSSYSLYDFNYTVPDKPASTMPRTGDIIAFLQQKLLVEVDGAIGNLAAVTNESFSSDIASAAFDKKTSSTVSVDYADVQVIRSLLYGIKCQLELLLVYGLDVHLPSIIDAGPEQLQTYKQLLQNDATLLAPKDVARLPVARTALINFIDTYTAAFGLIANRSGADGHLFVADVPMSDAPVTTSKTDLRDIKQALAEVKAALDGPRFLSFMKGSERTRYLDLSKLFNASAPINFRNQIANCATGTALPDITLGGLFPMGLPFLEEQPADMKHDLLGVACSGHEIPKVSVSPPFSGQIYYARGGIRSAPRQIFIKNLGTAPLQVSSMSLEGVGAGDFSILPDTCGSTSPTIQPADECSVRVDYFPATAGQSLADLLIQTNDPDTPRSHVSLFGVSQAPTIAGPANTSYPQLVADPVTAGTLYTIVYARGIYKSTNGGTTWTPINSGLSSVMVTALAIDPSSSQTLYAGTFGGGIFKTTNGGASWGAVNSGLANTYISSLAVSRTSPQTVYAGTYAGLFKSSNGGVSWSAVGNDLLSGDMRKIMIDPNSADTVYAVSWDYYFSAIKLFKTTDGGTTWNDLTDSLPTNSSMPTITVYYSIETDPVTSGILYLATAQGLLKSSNGGASWEAVGAGVAFFAAKIVVSPTNPLTIYLCDGNNQFYRTTDGGATFEAVASECDGTLTVDPFSSSTVYEAKSNSVKKSTDGGSTWTELSLGDWTTAQLKSIAVDPGNASIMYTATYGAGVGKSSDSGASWSYLANGLSNKYVNAVAVSSASSQTVYAATDNGVFKSSNGGNDWASMGSYFTGAVTWVKVLPGSSTTVFASDGSRLYRSNDSGVSWSDPGLTGVKYLGISSSSPSIMYVGTTQGIYKSTNGGVNWQSSSTGLVDPSNGSTLAGHSVAVHPTNPDTVFVGTNIGVFSSTDGGANWSSSSSGITQGMIYSVIFDTNNPSNLYARNSSLIYKSADGGTTWNTLQGYYYYYPYYGITPFDSETETMALPPSSDSLLVLTYTGLQRVPIIVTPSNPSYQLTVNRSGGEGAITITDITKDPFYAVCYDASCADMHLGGSEVQVTAAPDPNYIFNGWSGCDTLDGLYGCTVTMDGAKSVTATFVPDTRPLSLVASPGSGTYATPPKVALISNKMFSQIFYTLDGTQPTSLSNVYVAPLQLTGSTTLKYFGVVGDETGQVKTETYTVSNYTLGVTLDGTGEGSVNSNPSGINVTTGTATAQYPGGTTVTLYPTASVGSDFSGWSRYCYGSEPCSVYLDDNINLTAIFELLGTIRIFGTTPVYYGTLQAAYEEAVNGNWIQAQALEYAGNLFFNRDVSIGFQGGFDETFSAPNGISAVSGSVTIERGSLTIENLAIK